MFLRKGSRSLFTANVLKTGAHRCSNVAQKNSETEIISKWKQKLANENISEVDSSIKHILNYVQKMNIGIEHSKNLLTDEHLKRFEQLCECRMARMPVQYIIGNLRKKYFGKPNIKAFKILFSCFR